MNLEGRLAPLVAGIGLMAIAVALSAAAQETAVATVVAIGGVGLMVYAFVFDRLESFGPGGLHLRELKDRAARQIEVREIHASDAGIATESATLTRNGHGQAAAAVRAAETPEQLIDTLVALIDRPEASAEQRGRIRSDDAMRTRDERYGPTSGSRG